MRPGPTQRQARPCRPFSAGSKGIKPAEFMIDFLDIRDIIKESKLDYRETEG